MGASGRLIAEILGLHIQWPKLNGFAEHVRKIPRLLRYSSSASNPIDFKACASPKPRHSFLIADLPGSLIAPILQMGRQRGSTQRIEGPALKILVFLVRQSAFKEKFTQLPKGTKDLNSLTCACLCVCACVGSMPILWHPVEVKGQPPVSVITFYVVWNKVFCFSVCIHHQVSWPQAPGESPASTSHLAGGALGLQVCATLSNFTWFWGSKLRSSRWQGSCLT